MTTDETHKFKAPLHQGAVSPRRTTASGQGARYSCRDTGFMV
ncbi:MAG: hypothetical protein WA974_07970 [Thermodesulfobacteriota bacterium]